MVGHIPSQRVGGLRSVTGIERPSTQFRCSVILAIALRKLGRSFGGRNSNLTGETLELRWHELLAPVGVNESGGSEDGQKCRKKFVDATGRDVPEREGERKPTKLIHHCENVLVFASSHWFRANNVHR